MPPHHLFVYGSLRAGVGHPMGARLRREAALIGPATLPGRLYAISWFPGVIESNDGTARVIGEVYRLGRPAATLHWLDWYEGMAPGQGRDADYERVRREVRLAGGETVAAWVYLYRRPVAGRRRVISGDWL